MHRVCEIDRAFKALAATFFFWVVAGFVYTGDLSEVVTSKGRALHFLIDVLLVGLLGRAGAAAMFAILGILAAVVILRDRENS